MAVGMAMAQQMMQQQGGVLGPQSTPAAAAPASAIPAPGAASGPPEKRDLLSPGDVANILGVSEGDVLATIEKGDLKAKQIGSAWRITRTALDEFLKS
jgi:excisionase family DNA binding protein